MRGATLFIRQDTRYVLFQSTLPMRGATGFYDSNNIYYGIFQSTLPMRGATQLSQDGGSSRGISIHAPHAGSDCCVRRIRAPIEISIHAPHAGSDPPGYTLIAQGSDFNPRSPCGERLRRTEASAHHRYFNPRSPCGERHGTVPGCRYIRISIHAPHAGSDCPRIPSSRLHLISIHAPHAGSDVLKMPEEVRK